MSLLTTKLYIPPVRPDLVVRDRLIERLNAGLQRKLTLISAPAGFGKTTLLSAWIHSLAEATSPVQVAWVSLDAGDNDPARFLAYLLAAMQRTDVRIGQDLSVALQSPQPPRLPDLLTGLINEIAELASERPAPGPVGVGLTGRVREGAAMPASVGQEPSPRRLILVLDDYHTLQAQPIHDAVSFLLDHLPPQMHLVIATRVDPPLPIARLRGRGELVELRQADLRFSLEEATEFLNRTMDLELSAAEVMALTTRTEGWITGLHMASLAMHARLQGAAPIGRAQEEVSAFIDAFTGSDRYVLDYLVEEVLERQPENIQAFLLHTAILDRLTGPLCDAVVTYQQVTRRVDEPTTPQTRLADLSLAEYSGQEILEHLEHANLFVVPLDNQRQWYRYHRLFADLLLQRLTHARPDLVPTLHRRAAEWYEKHGVMAKATDHALAGHDFERAARLIEQNAEECMLRSELATFHGWLEKLPEEIVRSRPLLCVYHALAMLLSRHPLGAAEAWLQHAIDADRTGAVAGEVATVQALIAVYQQDEQRSSELARRALELVPESRTFFRSFVATYLGLIFLYRGDVATATSSFEEAARIGQRTGNRVSAVLATCHLAELSVLQGQLCQAETIYRKAVEHGTTALGQRLPIAGVALIGLGNLMLEWNRPDEAAHYLTEGIELVTLWSEIGAISGHVGLAWLHQRQGNPAAVRRSMDTAKRIAQEFDAMDRDDRFVAAHRAMLSVSQGDLDAAWRWAEGCDLADGLEVQELLDAHEGTALAKVYLARGQPDKALQVLQVVLQAAESAGWLGLVVRVRILESLAHAALGEETHALANLERALSLAQAGGFVRVFLDEGEPLAILLRRAASRDMAPQYVTSLLAAFVADLAGPTRAGRAPSEAPPAVHQPLVEPLSDRELEVLRMLRSPLTSTEIAGRLYISPNTARSHIKNIYGKLGVHRRAEAVERALELNLL